MFFPFVDITLSFYVPFHINSVLIQKNIDNYYLHALFVAIILTAIYLFIFDMYFVLSLNMYSIFKIVLE